MRNKIITTLLLSILILSLLAITVLVINDLKVVELYVFLAITIVTGCFTLKLYGDEIGDLKRSCDNLKYEQNRLDQTCNKLHNQVENITEYYESRISELRETYLTEIDNLNNQLDNPILITDVFDLYQASLVIRKYNIHKYVIERQSKEVHIYCNMQTYTKMSINKEILPNIKYHIDGTNVIL